MSGDRVRLACGCTLAGLKVVGMCQAHLTGPQSPSDELEELIQAATPESDPLLYSFRVWRDGK